MRIKPCVIVMLSTIILSSVGMGLSYSLDGDNIGLAVPSCYCDVAFTSAEAAIPPDNEDTIDVASFTVDLNPDGSTINIDIFNAYPAYQAYINFTIINLGNKPIILSDIIGTYDTNAIDISLDGVIEDDTLFEGESWEGSLTVELLQSALEGTIYQFSIEFVFENDQCPEYEFIETVEVFANNPNPVSSSALLEDGVSYTLVTTGVAFAGDTIDFDAKYSITNRIPGDTWTDLVSGYVSYGTILLNLLVDGIEVDWGSYNPEHTYEYTIVGDGTSIDLLIYDIYYPNNSGSLFVDVYKVI